MSFLSGLVALFLGSTVLLIALVVLIVVVVRRVSKQEDDAVRWAARAGWAVVQRPDVPWVALLPGQSRNGISVLLHRSIAGRPVAVAQYAYQHTEVNFPVQQGSNMTNHEFAVAWVGLPRECPFVAVHRAGRLDFLDRLDPLQRLDERFFGAPRPIPTGDAEFDRRFRVLASDPAHVRIVGPALRQAHLADAVPHWSAADHDLVTWRSNHFTEPQTIIDLTEGLTRVADLLGR